jgi:hypothetical protein
MNIRSVVLQLSYAKLISPFLQLLTSEELHLIIDTGLQEECRIMTVERTCYLYEKIANKTTKSVLYFRHSDRK